MIGHWTMCGFGKWAVTLQGNDQAIGLVGLYFPSEWPERKVGWHLWDEGAEGKGYAFEAALAACAHAFGTLGWTTAVSYIAARNTRSIALATRLGAVRDAGAATPDNDPVLVYRDPAEVAR